LEPGLSLRQRFLTRLVRISLNTIIFFEVGTTPVIFFTTNDFLYGTKLPE